MTETKDSTVRASAHTMYQKLSGAWLPRTTYAYHNSAPFHLRIFYYYALPTFLLVNLPMTTYAELCNVVEDIITCTDLFEKILIFCDFKMPVTQCTGKHLLTIGYYT